MISRAYYLTDSAKLNKLLSEHHIKKAFKLSGDYLAVLTRMTQNQRQELSDHLSSDACFFEYSELPASAGYLICLNSCYCAKSAEHFQDKELKAFFLKLAHQNNNYKNQKWLWNNKCLDFSSAPHIMGILNITPDSFSDGGRYINPETAVDHALMMAEQGASIIDIGGESTRPGSEPVSESQEMDRILPVIEHLHKNSDVIISVDTYKSKVAEAALEAGADMINDISGGTFDAEMMRLAARKKCPCILMHIKGKPRDMQVNPFYEDVIEEIYVYFEDRIKQAEQAGIDKIILDPGIGFGKRLQDNLQILKNLKDFKWLDKPLLIGVSRKSFIGALLSRETDSRLAGSLTSAIIAVQNGAGIIRVHDVQETADAIKIYQSIKETDT